MSHFHHTGCTMENETRNEGTWEKINENRDFMKCPNFFELRATSDQEKKLPQPPLSHPTVGAAIELKNDFDNVIVSGNYIDLLDSRRSQRMYDTTVPMTQSQLAFMLWSTQGIQKTGANGYATFRPVPSGGARHPFETYIVVQNVEDLSPGIYRYLPLEHVGEKRVSIEFVSEFDNHEQRITDMVAGQKWAATAPVIILYTCVAYRAEWRYTVMAHRVVLIDVGHVGQNLMFSAEAMGLGSCNMAAYDQKLCDETLGLDGYEEYTVYVHSVGKVAKP